MEHVPGEKQRPRNVPGPLAYTVNRDQDSSLSSEDSASLPSAASPSPIVAELGEVTVVFPGILKT